MLFQRLLQEMFEGPFGRRNLLQVKALSMINPSRFYVENIRALYDISPKNAQRICDTAVRDGFVKKKIGIVCPNDERIIQSFDSHESIPEKIICDLCEAEGEENYEFASVDCERIEFYELIRDAN